MLITVTEHLVVVNQLGSMLAEQRLVGRHPNTLGFNAEWRAALVQSG